jgi:hypothetical protein
MLDELADETPELSAGEWVARTSHKVRVRRRARWTGAGAAAALVLAAAATIVPVVDNAAPEPVAPAEGDGVFPEYLRGGELVAARTNQAGESSFEWEVALDRPTPSWSFCQVPKEFQTWGGLLRGNPALKVVLALNGRRWRSQPCAHLHWYGYPPVSKRMVIGLPGAVNSAPISQARSNLQLPQAWKRRYGWAPGESITVSAWLERRGGVIEIPRAEFGVAFYNGFALPFGGDIPASAGLFELVPPSGEEVGSNRH